MWILILLDHRDCHLNSISNRCVSLRDDPIILPIRKINYKFSQWCLFHLPQVAFVFSALPPFFCRDSYFLIKYHFIHVKSLHSFQSMFLPGGSHEDVLQVFHSSFFFFSGGLNSSLQCWSHSFPCFKCFSHAGATLNHSSRAIHLFRSAEDISEDSCFHSASILTILRLLSHSSHLILPAQSFF